jgi:hypothetical protein
VVFVFVLLHGPFKTSPPPFFLNNAASSGAFVGCQHGVTQPPFDCHLLVPFTCSCLQRGNNKSWLKLEVYIDKKVWQCTAFIIRYYPIVVGEEPKAYFYFDITDLMQVYKLENIRETMRIYHLSWHFSIEAVRHYFRFNFISLGKPKWQKCLMFLNFIITANELGAELMSLWKQ